MDTVRKIVLFLSLLLVALLTGVFAYNNPARITLDIGFAQFENISIVLAFAVFFGIGWLSGIATVGFSLLRAARAKRILGHELKLAKAEVNSLRSLPLHDAD